jgi:hypothetical protein
MITTPSKAIEKLCVIPKLTETGRCAGSECMSWRYWIGQKPIKNGLRHGLKDNEKKGYCGMTGSY